MAIQQLMLGVGASKKTYRDDVFNTYLYKGTNGANTLNTGLNMSGEGGLTWIKSRSSGSTDHTLFDTVRGVNKKLRTDSSEAESTLSANQTFTSTGFTLNNTFSDINDHNVTYTSWNFLKAKGFFDIVTYTGNSSTNQTISHSLGSIPGCIMIKSTSHTGKWTVYHRGAGQNKYLYLDEADAASSSGSPDWSNISSTSFEALGATSSNENGYGYVAYLFAGGESTAAAATSISFNGVNDFLEIPDHADFDLGNGNFTAEMWVKSNANVTSGNKGLLGQWASGNKSWAVSWSRANQGGDGWAFKYSTDGSNETGILGPRLDDDQWHHIAVVRDSTYIKLYTDGTLSTTHTHSGATFYNSAATCRIANEGYAGVIFGGEISNVRLVKGTSVYTSSFKAPTEPLKNITNTKLLCCNGSSTTSSTVTPGTITDGTGATLLTDSPFDDPAGFVFGDSKEGIIKCGSYVGNGSSTGPEIHLGWEPDFVLLKNADNGSEHWKMFDSMRGIPTDGNDPLLEPSTGNSENAGNNALDLTARGFKIKLSGDFCNASGNNIIYMAIRRPDGYVQKPVEDATKVFAMTYGTSSSNPSYVSNFPVDFATNRRPATSEDWYNSARLIQGKYLLLNETNAEVSHSGQMFDYSNGWQGQNTDLTQYFSWMWRRHAGFDVVTYKGDGVAGRQVPHSLSKNPEMIWVKKRDGTTAWNVGHKGLNGGTNPWDYSLVLNDTETEADDINKWNDTAPTSTHFTVGDSGRVNTSGNNYIAILFASVSGVSKVGFYNGWNWPDTNTVECGFQPRFVLAKKVTGTGGNPRDWHLFDTVRGIASGGGSDKRLEPNNTGASHDSTNYLELTSSGFTPKDGDIHSTTSDKFIFYAHA